MLKALLIIVGMSGMNGEYTTEMPSMEECLEMRTVITQQDPDIKTICLPVADETARIKEFFWLFMDMVEHIKQNELDWTDLNDTTQSREDEPTDSAGTLRE